MKDKNTKNKEIGVGMISKLKKHCYDSANYLIRHLLGIEDFNFQATKRQKKELWEFVKFEVRSAYQRGLITGVKRGIFEARLMGLGKEIGNTELLTQEQHDYLVKELGFKEVRSRCPVCYTVKLIENNLKR